MVACKKSDDNVTVLMPSQYPATPTYLSPADSAANVPLIVDLLWKACKDPQGDPVYYDVAVSISSDMTNVVFAKSNLTQPNVIADLSYVYYDAFFYWQVTAKDNHNNVSIGPIWQFSVTSGKTKKEK
jgi:hypothetical protein